MSLPSRVASGGRSAVPWGLVLMLVLVALVERTISGRDVDFVHPWSWDWKLSGKAARSKSRGCEVLCFGDSLVKFGVLPRVIEGRLGKPAYNLAVGAGPTPASYFLLRRALDSGARPSALLIDTKPHLLTYDVRASARHWPEVLGTRECLDLALAARDAGFFAEMMTARALPSARARHEIRANVLAALRGEDASPRGVMPGVWRNWGVNRGAQVMARDPGSTGRSFAWAAELMPPRGGCDPVNVAYLRRFLDLADRRGIPVYWLLPPISPETQAESERVGVDAKFARFVREMQGRYTRVVVVDGRHAGYGRDVHVDPVHLDRQGASVLSAELAAILRRGPTGPAWVALPPYRDQAAGAPVEDLDESRVALLGRAGRERR